jgi:hypothetical protein
MHPKRALLIVIVSALLTCGVAALLVNIADRKREERFLEKCPCPSESCPHPSRSVE